MTEAARLLGRGLRQPDRRSCGASALVAARMLADSTYAGYVGADLGPRFRHEVLATHRRVTSVFDTRGRLQLPWPRAVGTPPWAVAHQLAAIAAPTPYRTRLALTDAAAELDRAHAAVAAGHPVALYVGDRLLPRHVVLAFETTGEALRVYEPSAGRLATVTSYDAQHRRLGLAGWDVLWFVVGPRSALPRARRSPA